MSGKFKSRNFRGYAALVFSLLSLFVFRGSPVFPMSERESGVSDKLVLGLEQSVSLAVQNSFELQEIRAREGIYDMAITESLREYFPSLTFSYMQNDEVNVRNPDSRISRLSVDTELVIYDGGRRRLNYDVAKLNSFLARNDYRIALNRLIVQVREHYLNLLRLRETVSIYEQTLEMARVQLEFIKMEYELGDATGLSVMEIEAKTGEVELALKEAEDNYAEAVMQYRLLLRLNRRTPLEITGDIENDFIFIPVRGLDSEELAAKALKTRKEVESSIVQSEISRKNHEINRNYYRPTVSLGFNYNLSDEEFPPREKGWGINMKVTSRLLGSTFSGGGDYREERNYSSRALRREGSVDVLNDMSYRREIDESGIEMAAADDEKKMIREHIAAEVTSLCRILENSWDMIKVAGGRLELYDSLLKIERLRADIGESARYDLLEREMERGEAAVALLNAKIKYLTAVSTLELSIGADVNFLQKYIESKGKSR